MARADDRFRLIRFAIGLLASLALAACSQRALSGGRGGAHGGGGMSGTGGSGGDFTVTVQGDGEPPTAGGGVLGSSGGSGGKPDTAIQADGIAPMAGGGVIGPSSTIDSQPADVAEKPDAEPDVSATGSACPTLGSCECMANSDCAPLAESCWCPTECGVVCKCGGGRYWGCAPVGLATCASASDRLAKLCPDLAAAVTRLCESSPSECIANCLNEITSCDALQCMFVTVAPGCSGLYRRCINACMLASRGHRRAWPAIPC
jgi:hypothetical protein